MSHTNTLFNEILRLIPRHISQKLERKHACGRSSRKFGFKEHFTFMLFVMLTASRSLRDAITSLSTQSSRLYHWGLGKVCRSTVSDANRGRPWQFFEDLYLEVCNLCVSCAPHHRFKFKNKLFSLDSTIISLTASIFAWAAYRNSKKGVKIHTLLDHDGNLPSFVRITEAKEHDSKSLEEMPIPRGSMLICDRAYSAVKWFIKLCKNNIFFVTRAKIGMDFITIEKQNFTIGTGVTSDYIIEMKNSSDKLTLRRIGFYDKDNNHYYFLTNNFELDAETIAELYKERWRIEIFFKEIKQFLKIKKFIGTNENAVKIQIYTALIAYLLIALQKFIGKFGYSVGQLFQIIKINLILDCTLEKLLKPKPTSQNNERRLLFLTCVC